MIKKEEFNDRYRNYLEKDSEGLSIEYPAIIQYLDGIFQDLIKIEGFKYSEIKTKFGIAKVYTNLSEIFPFMGRLIDEEMEKKINILFMVENEIKSRNLITRE